MAFYLPPLNQTNRELAPEGTHLATCCQVIQFGTQRTDFDDKERPELRLTWELLDEFNSKGWPFLIGRTYNFSSHPSSNLILDLEAWCGGLGERFDLEQLIGLVAVVGIQHKSGRNGDYAQMSSIMQPPKGVERRRPPRGDTVVFTFSPYRPEVYEGLPEWTRKKIAGSPEFRVATGQAPLPAPQRQQSLPASSAGDALDDDIPF